MTLSTPTTLLRTLGLAAAALSLAGAAQAAGTEDAMLKLATTSGCMTCHHIEPGAKGPDGMNPIGPAWKDVATKYKGQKDAAKQTHRHRAGRLQPLREPLEGQGQRLGHATQQGGHHRGGRRQAGEVDLGVERRRQKVSPTQHQHACQRLLVGWREPVDALGAWATIAPC